MQQLVPQKPTKKGEGPAVGGGEIPTEAFKFRLPGRAYKGNAKVWWHESSRGDSGVAGVVMTSKPGGRRGLETWAQSRDDW